MNEGLSLEKEAGANLVGGGCGTTPEHIRAVGEKVQEFLSSKG